MSDCLFGVSPINYPDPDPDPDVLFVGKNCSRNSNCQTELVGVVWDSCCIAVLHTHIHGSEHFSLN